jgi:general secretion pathway protein F
MAAFDYTALNADGKHKKGVLQGDNARQVRAQLRAQGLLPLKVKQVTTLINSDNLAARMTSRRLSKSDLALATRQMATLLAAGIPIDDVLSGVAKQTDKTRVASVLLGVRSKVMEGFSLAEAMEEFPFSFPKLYRTTVGAGERSGKLDQVLLKLADYTEEQHRIRQRIKQAMVYPTLMTIVSVAIVVFLLIYVVPQIVTVFTQNNQTLPTATVILIAISKFVHHYGLYVLAGIFVVIYLFYRAYKHDSFRVRVHNIFLRLPILGRNMRIINCARFGRTFGILNAATVPVLDAMTAASRLITLIPMQKAVEESVGKVREGANIHVALGKTGYFPPMFLHLVASGENSGQLEQMLDKAAESLENDVELLIQNVLTLFEPIMILVMGAIVLYIVLAIMLPIFNLDQFSG